MTSDTLTLPETEPVKQEVTTHDHAVMSLGDQLELSLVLLDIGRIQDSLTRATEQINHAGSTCGGFRGKKLYDLEKMRLNQLAEQADRLSRNARNLADNLRSYIE